MSEDGRPEDGRPEDGRPEDGRPEDGQPEVEGTDAGEPEGADRSGREAETSAAGDSPEGESGVGLPPPPTPPPPTDPPGGEAGRPGLPWETLSGRNFSGALETIRLVLLEPATAFARMKVEGPLGDPLLFLILFGTLGSFFGLLWNTAFRTMFARLGPLDMSEVALANTFGMVMLLLAPVFVLLAAAIATLILHLALMLFGGAPRPMETTLRTIAYTNGATYLFMAIPFCGGIISGIWWLVITSIGLREAQGVPAGRAVAAVLAPIVFICCCCALLWSGVMMTAISMQDLMQ